MKNKMLLKLKSTGGESFAEVMIAVLISSLGLLMMAQMMMSSAKLIRNSDAVEVLRQKNINQVEEFLAGDRSKTSDASFTIGKDGSIDHINCTLETSASGQINAAVFTSSETESGTGKRYELSAYKFE